MRQVNSRNSIEENDIDRIDFHILRILQENAWISTKELAAAIGLSLSAASQRIKLLKENDYITGAHAVADQKIMGIGLEALFMIQLDKHKEATVEDFIDDILKLPEVLSAYLITGSFDIIANIVVRDTDHLKSLAFEHFTNRTFITKIETSIVYTSRHKRVINSLHSQ